MPDVPTLDLLAQAMHAHRASRLREAEAKYRQVLASNPTQPDALHLLGVIAHQVGRNPEAEALIVRAIELWPARAEFHNNLGLVLQALGRFNEAIGRFRKALQLNPAYADAHTNLGNILRDQGDLDAAETAYRAALTHAPRDGDIVTNLGNVLFDQGRSAEARECYLHALELNPNSAATHSNFIYAGLFEPAVSLEMQASETRHWSETHESPRRPAARSYPNLRDPERRLKVGYLSAYFCRHVVGQNILPLFELRNRSRFEFFCYADVPRPDALTERFRCAADGWRNITGWSDAAIADAVARDQVDILVDLNLHMDGGKLLVFARKPAPIQVSFAGYPGSTGLQAIDYHFTDRRLEPAATPTVQSVGKMVVLSNTFWCYKPLEPDVQPGALPSLTAGYLTFGCLNNFRKVNPTTLRLWARVLTKVPHAQLLVLCPAGRHRDATRAQLAAIGVDPSRIRFHPRVSQRRYLELHRDVDIILDTFPYNGHTTTCDALWMGIPVISLAGPTPVSRAGLSILSAVGEPDLVAEHPDAFVNLAVRLASDPDRLLKLRVNLRHTMETSPLMDSVGFTRQIESGYRAMWRRWCEGLPLDDIILA